jgi:hypothetical protein
MVFWDLSRQDFFNSTSGVTIRASTCLQDIFFLSLLSTLLGTPNEIKERKKVKKHLEGISKL